MDPFLEILIKSPPLASFLITISILIFYKSRIKSRIRRSKRFQKIFVLFPRVIIPSNSFNEPKMDMGIVQIVLYLLASAGTLSIVLFRSRLGEAGYHILPVLEVCSPVLFGLCGISDAFSYSLRNIWRTRGSAK